MKKHSPHRLTLFEYHALARQGMQLYAITKDPLTASGVELLLQAASVPLTAPQQNAALVLKKQVGAYKVVFPDTLT